jgi:hypothetical protein
VRSLARAATLLLLGATALAAWGCGSARPTSTAELALEREDLVFVCRALQSLEGQSEAEVNATKAAWPFVYRGLPASSKGLYGPQVEAAIETAERLQLPTLLGEKEAAALTGPASSIAGLYRAFEGLASKGWQLLGGSIYQIEHGSATAASFARANVALYIDSIYDAHFSLAQIGKQLLKAYKKLGGQKVFEHALSQAEVDALAAAYSEGRDRPQPHVGVQLGS